MQNNSISRSEGAADLLMQHRSAVLQKLPWPVILQVFHEHPWFSETLHRIACSILKKRNLSCEFLEDIKQESWLHLAKSIKRKPALLFDSSRGDYGSFLSSVIFRSCLMGARKIAQATKAIDNESQHPQYDDWEHFHELLDLRQSVCQVDEPYRSTIQALCRGLSINEIAAKRRCDKRTIYRWLQSGIEQLQKIYHVEPPKRAAK